MTNAIISGHKVEEVTLLSANVMLLLNANIYVAYFCILRSYYQIPY